jgi:hypothetical protein
VNVGEMEEKEESKWERRQRKHERVGRGNVGEIEERIW